MGTRTYGISNPTFRSAVVILVVAYAIFLLIISPRRIGHLGSFAYSDVASPAITLRSSQGQLGMAPNQRRTNRSYTLVV